MHIVTTATMMAGKTLEDLMWMTVESIVQGGGHQDQDILPTLIPSGYLVLTGRAVYGLGTFRSCGSLLVDDRARTV